MVRACHCLPCRLRRPSPAFHRQVLGLLPSLVQEDLEGWEPRDAVVEVTREESGAAAKCQDGRDCLSQEVLGPLKRVLVAVPWGVAVKGDAFHPVWTEQ